MLGYAPPSPGADPPGAQTHPEQTPSGADLPTGAVLERILVNRGHLLVGSVGYPYMTSFTVQWDTQLNLSLTNTPRVTRFYCPIECFLSVQWGVRI